jgi:hypothetical protein
MLCAEKGLSLKAFATDLLLRAIEEYEDHTLSRKARKRMKELKSKDNVSFDKACELADWDDESKI